MIEKTINDTFSEMGAEADAEAAVPEDKQQRGESSNSLSRVTKSLMEDDDEEDEDEDGERVALSRNPSLVDDLEDGERSTREQEPRRPSHLIQDEIDEEESQAVSKPTAHCAPNNMVPICQDDLPLLPGCQGQTLADHIDMMTQCRHPLELFSVFNEHSHNPEAVDQHHLLPGMYSLPATCEYCGAADLTECADECQRPKSFFRKKRPPFCCRDSEKWDPITDMEVASSKMVSATSSPDCENQRVLPTGVQSPSFLGLGDLFRKPSEAGI